MVWYNPTTWFKKKSNPSSTSTTSSIPSGGTYYTGSGTYVSPSGQGYSMAVAPAGSRIVASKDPFITRGGGGGAPAPKPAVSVSITEPEQPTTQPSQQPTPDFTGKVAQYYKGQKEIEKYYVAGEETGRIVTPTERYTRGGVDIVETEKPYAVTTTPSKFTFERPSVGVQEVTFKETGAEVLERVGVDLPALDTTPPTRDERIEEIKARAGLPFFERIKYAYGDKGVSIRGAIRAGFELEQIGLEKIGLTPEKISKIPFFGEPVSSHVGEDIALSMFMLGPTAPTTTQVERELFEVSQVKLVGATQQVGRGRVITRAGFKVTRAGKTVRGVVKAESGLTKVTAKIGKIKVTSDQEMVVSAVRGREISRGLRFPSGKEVVKPGQLFKGAEIAKVTPKGKLYFTRAIGVTKTGPENVLYKAGGISMQKGEYLVQIGATTTKRGAGISAGLLKIMKEPPTTTFVVRGISGARAGTTTALKSISSQAAKSVVRAGVQIPPKLTTQIIPIASLQKAPTLKLKTEPQQVVKIETTQIVTTKQIPAQRIISKTKQRYVQRQPQRYVQRQVTPQTTAQKVLQKPLVTTKQKYAQRQARKLIQKSILRTPTLLFTPITPKPPTKKLPRTPYKRYGRPKPSPRPRGLYDVFVRRFGKFKPIGKGLSLKQAGVLGREVVGGTLGATYKITGKIPKGLKVPKGFYKKITPTGVEIIEKPKYRLSRATEKEEIQMFKLLKGGRKKKKKK